MTWPPYRHSWFCHGSRKYPAYNCRSVFGVGFPYYFSGRVCSLWEETLETKDKRGSWEMVGLILLSCIRANFYIMHLEVIGVAVARLTLLLTYFNSLHLSHALQKLLLSFPCPMQDNREVSVFALIAILGWKSHTCLPGLGVFHFQTFLLLLPPTDQKTPWSLLG